MLVDVYERIAEDMKPVAYWLLPNGWLVNKSPHEDYEDLVFFVVHQAWLFEEGADLLGICIERADYREQAPDGEIHPCNKERLTIHGAEVQWVNGWYMIPKEEE